MGKPFIVLMIEEVIRANPGRDLTLKPELFDKLVTALIGIDAFGHGIDNDNLLRFWWHHQPGSEGLSEGPIASTAIIRGLRE